jgi:GNAT superfamily N-acetyltransferase
MSVVRAKRPHPGRGPGSGNSGGKPFRVTRQPRLDSLGLVDLIPVDPASLEQLRAWQDVTDAVFAADVPDLPPSPFEELVASARTPRASVREERYLLADEGTPVAVARASFPLLDNTEQCPVLVAVHPEHRRRGHGRALFDFLVERARVEGRARLIAEVAEPLVNGDDAPGPAFATSVGATRALDEIRRVLDLDALDEPRLDALEAEARSRSAGYETLSWIGPTPEDLIDGYAQLMGQMSVDAPMGDLDWEPEVWDADRVREQDQLVTDQRRTRLLTAVRHQESGRWVAFSSMGVSKLQYDPAYQWDTIVLHDHRGHRLGMLAKVINLRLLRREVPEARRVVAWNAESNTHMVAINDALGFRPVERLADWVYEIEQP